MVSVDKATDFVITWVDNTDPVWRDKKARFVGMRETEGNTEARYRDWDTLKYWFRGVEKFAPWVRYIHFVTDDQKPEWLNVDHPKLKWVKHTDFIPEEYLPTFSANPIEWNLHRICGLADQFVYFNDDMFLIKETVPDDYFVEGLPCDLPNFGPIYPNGVFSNMMFNNTELLNRHFSFGESVRKHWKKWVKYQSINGLVKLALYGRRNAMVGSGNWHICSSYLKKNYEKLWEVEYDEIHATCQNRQRTRADVTNWCVRNWQLLTGEFYPQKPLGKQFTTASLKHSDAALEYLRKQKGKVICLNDGETEDDFYEHKRRVIEAFEELLPEKSSFEL